MCNGLTVAGSGAYNNISTTQANDDYTVITDVNLKYCFSNLEDVPTTVWLKLSPSLIFNHVS